MAGIPSVLPQIPAIGANPMATPGAVAGLAGAPNGAGILGGTNSNTPGAFGTELGWNVGTGQLALSGLGALGNLWSSWNTQNMARDQFDFTKRFAERNLANQTRAYNTALTDRLTARGFTQGTSAADTQAAIAANRLPG